MTCVSTSGRLGRELGTMTAPARVTSTTRQMLQAALAAAIAKKRTETEARWRPMSPAETEALETYWQKRTVRAMRAKEAQREKRVAVRARGDNPAPTPTGMWAKAMSLQAATDTRLTMGARVALQVIRALSARCKRISRNGLAVTLGVHPRTAQRYLSELRERGYIRTRLIANRLGWVVAQVIEITERVLPKHHQPRTAESLADGISRAMSTRETRRNQGETALSPCKTNEIYLLGIKDQSGLPEFVGDAS
jgi:DNA-binding transcriptional regulator YhcF (GntR family)